MNKKHYLVIFFINFFVLVNSNILAMELGVFTDSEEEESPKSKQGDWELCEIGKVDLRVKEIFRKELNNSFNALGKEKWDIYSLRTVTVNLNAFYDACGRQEAELNPFIFSDKKEVWLLDAPILYGYSKNFHELLKLNKIQINNGEIEHLISNYYRAVFKHIPTTTNMQNGKSFEENLLNSAEQDQEDGVSIDLRAFASLIKVIRDAAKKEN